MSAGHTAGLYLDADSPLHRLAPETKIVAAFVFAFAVAVTPRRSIWAFGVDAVIVVLGLRIAGFTVGGVLRRLAAVAPFVTFAFFLPFVAGGPGLEILGVELSSEGLWGTWNILAKSVLGVLVSSLLSGTTRLPDLLLGLARLRVPPPVTAIIAFMFRYLDLIVGAMAQMRAAMVARGHSPRWLWQAKPIASASGALFVRTYERGERVHGAMLARGFSGAMPALEDTPTRRTDWVLAAIAPCAASIVAVTSLLS